MSFFDNAKAATFAGKAVAKLELAGKKIWEAIKFTNQVPISIDTDKSTFNGKGWIEKTRLSSSGATKANDYASTTGYIPAASSATIRIKGVAWDNGADYVCTYNSGFTFLTALNGQGSYGGGTIVSRVGDVVTVKLPTNSNIAYIRVSAIHSSKDAGYASVAKPIEGPGSYLIVTVNEEIT